MQFKEQGMNLVCLFSGGKDSCFALFKAIKEGHSISSLVTIKSLATDSFMYHTPNIHLTLFSAKAMGFPLVVGETSAGKEKELVELKKILMDLKEQKKIEGIVSGAIASRYQKRRVDAICEQLNLKSIALLWKKNQEKLLREMLENNFEIMVVGVYAAGLNEKWLGRILDEKALRELIELKKKYKINVSGEGGEFETLVLNCPLFKKRIKVKEAEKKWDGVRGELLIKEVKLV